MTTTLSFRDIEQLSAYLDGELKPKELARLEARLESDPELVSALEELRQARGVLRQLPQRRAPRNFTLTPNAVGQKPPLPRSLPIFQYASVLATLLLFLSFFANFMAPRLTPQAVSVPYGIGGSGGGAEPEMEIPAPVEEGELMQEMPAEEEPAAPTFRAESAEPEEPAPPAAPELALPTTTPALQPPAADSMEIQATPAPSTEPSFAQAQEKNGVQVQEKVPVESGAQRDLVPLGWQIVLAVLALGSALVAFLMRQMAASKWRAHK